MLQQIKFNSNPAKHYDIVIMVRLGFYQSSFAQNQQYLKQVINKIFQLKA